MANQQKGKNKRQKQAIIRILFMVLILICVNILASYLHTGFDLTKEKRFTLTSSTKKMLQNMQEVAVIDVYLKGKLPADLQRMQEAVREQLTAFKNIAGNKIIYRFIDPFEGKSDNEQKQIARDLHQKGIEYIPLSTKEDEGYSMKICFPYALLQYNGKEMPISLIEAPMGKSRSEQTTYSCALMEYKFASAINQLSKPKKPLIGYMFGHNEDMSVHSIDMLRTLSALYNLDSLNLSRTVHISNAYDAVIINMPTVPFTEPEKLKIDQYIMRGGHVLWVVNNMNASMDSLKQSQKFLAVEFGLNLEDMLFRYGARVNNDLIEDLQNAPIMIMSGNRPQKFPWVYYPRLNPTSEHPIVRNMDFILGGFTSSIDTILTAGIKKTVLLQSSKYSRSAGSPVTVSLTKLTYPGKNENYNKPYQNVAVLMEGKFHSVYNNRLAPAYLRLLDSLKEPFKPVCDSSTSMIVTSVTNIFQNDFNQKDGPLPMGYYRLTQETFANSSFLLNCMEYLTDHSGILEARSKDVKMRLLDNGRVKDELTMWQWVNVCIPIAIVLVFASFYLFFRKRKYEIKNIKPATQNV